MTNTLKALLVLLCAASLVIVGCSDDKSGETRVIQGENRPPTPNPGPPAGAKPATTPATK